MRSGTGRRRSSPNAAPAPARRFPRICRTSTHAASGISRFIVSCKWATLCASSKLEKPNSAPPMNAAQRLPFSSRHSRYAAQADRAGARTERMFQVTVTPSVSVSGAVSTLTSGTVVVHSTSVPYGDQIRRECSGSSPCSSAYAHHRKPHMKICTSGPVPIVPDPGERTAYRPMYPIAIPRYRTKAISPWAAPRPIHGGLGVVAGPIRPCHRRRSGTRTERASSPDWTGTRVAARLRRARSRIVGSIDRLSERVLSSCGD